MSTDSRGSIAWRCLLVATAISMTHCTRKGFRDVDPCAEIDCAGHGRCVVDKAGIASCACEPGYHLRSVFECAPGEVPCAGDCCGTEEEP